MAVNKERIRQKLANINNRGGNKDFWSAPKEGKATIRMFACPHSEDEFLEFFYHFNISKQSIFCPKKNGYASNCALCDLAAELYNSPNPQDKEISKKIFARNRFYGTMIDRADETMTPKYMGFSQTMYIQFLEWLGEDGGEQENFLDPNEGLDLVISTAKTPGKLFATITATAKRRESPLAASQKEYETIIKSVRPISEVFTSLSEADIVVKCKEYLAQLEKGDSTPPDDNENETVKGGNGNAGQFKVGTSEDIDAVFAANGLED